ncbi:hypothetical protein CCP3SC1AL1_350019 [Gammaproteobacteria bacterium]
MQGQHKNTFEKGMNKDYNILFQPQGTYRNCINCQLVSIDGNNYTIKDCMGNTRVFYINITYSTYVAPNITFAEVPRPIGFISFPDELIVFSTNDDSEVGAYGEIGRIQYDTYGEGIQPRASSPTNTYSGYVPLYHHVSLKFTIQRQIEGFASEETEGIRRVYWTDHLNSPRVFNVSDPIFTTYFAPSPATPLTSGESYMVLEGVVTHGGSDYGPGLPSGNVFVASGTSYVDDFGGNIPTTAKVIQYYPYQLLDFTPSRSMGTIKYKAYGTGNVICGSKIYFYRLTDPSNGIKTSWSYGCSPIHVGDSNDPIASPANVYFDAVGDGTTTVTVNSGKSVQIDISNIDTNFPRIQVACAEFDQLLDVPRLISIVADDLITGTDMVLEHTGNSNLGTLSLADITLFPVSIITCKTMTTNKNYMLIGNITEREEFQWADTSFTLGEVSSRFAVHEALSIGGGIITCPNTILYEDAVSCYANPTIIYAGHWYIVTDASGGGVTYNAVVYGAGEVFFGVSGATGVTIPGASQVRLAFVRNRYDKTSSAPVKEVILSTDGFASYKSPARSHHQRGFWAKEKYRIGLLPFDLKGNPMYVRWLGDYTFSDLMTNPLMTRTTTAAYDFYFLEQKGLNVSGITFTEAEISQISGFSIVRADRDKRIITEGMLMQTGRNGSLVRPAAGPVPSKDNVWLTSAPTYFSYICPDALCGFPMPNYVANTYMEGNTFYNANDYGAGDLLKSATSGDVNVESRWFGQASDSVTRKVGINAMTTIDEGVSQINFGSLSYTFMNQPEYPAAGVISTNNRVCGTGGINQNTMLGKKAEGGRRTIVELDSAIVSITPGVDYGSLAASDTYKLLIDVTVDNINQYGGTSDTALANTIYISCGHFQPITTQVKTDVETSPGSGIYTFNNIEVWGGDCFTTLVDYGHSLTDTGYGVGISNSWAMKFPCQTNCNYDLRRGRHPAAHGMGLTSPAVTFLSGTDVRLESFNCSQAYASQGIEFAYPALPVNFTYGNHFPQRVRYAGEKAIGEAIDSYRVFLTNDYKDANGQYGEINNLVTSKDQTIVVQNAQVSTTPILERQLLAAQTGAPTTIGTGGVVDRFDSVSTYFGNQHQHGMTKTEFGFVWFDMRRKAVVALDLSSGISEISKTEGMNGFFNEVIVDNLGSALNPVPLNSTTYEETSDRPLTGVGITGFYDPKFKMTYLTFKFLNFPSADKPISKDFTIAYYHTGKTFSHFWSATPAISYNHNQSVIMNNKPQNKTKYYGTGMASTAFIVGDIVSPDEGIEEYICTTAGTIAAYINPPSGGGTAWTKINTANELWVLNQPTTLGQSTAPDYQYNKVFGAVVNNEIEFVVNPQVEESFSVGYMEQQGNNVNATTVVVNAEGQTATDSNISSTNINYRYIWDKICSSLPVSSTGRVVNKYAKITLTKKNWTTDPTTVTNSVKILQFVKSIFNTKR